MSVSTICEDSISLPKPVGCVIEEELIIPSLLVLFISSVLCTFINALSNALNTPFLSYFRSMKDKRQRLIRVSQTSHLINPRETEVEEHTPFVDGSMEPSFSPHNRAFFQDVDSARPLAESLENPPTVVPSPLVEEALTDNFMEMRLQSQSCLFPYHAVFMALSTLKCLAMILLLQYHFDYVPGGWRRFCICGAGNILTTTCTPLIEYVANIALHQDNTQKTLKATIPDEEDVKDSVFIVEILVRIGSLRLTDLTTVLIQGSTFVIFASIFLPMFCVFCVPGCTSLYSWPLLCFCVLYVLTWRIYYVWGLPCLKHWAHPHNPSFAVVVEFLKATLLKVMTLFLLQSAVVLSFLMGMMLLDGFSYKDSSSFVYGHLLTRRLPQREMHSTFDWFVLASQLVL